jgi:hypothetical protein
VQNLKGTNIKVSERGAEQLEKFRKWVNNNNSEEVAQFDAKEDCSEVVLDVVPKNQAKPPINKKPTNLVVKW